MKMKKLISLMMAIILIASCTAAMAAGAGTYVISTKKEAFSGNHTAKILKLLKENEEQEKADRQAGKSASAEKSNAGWYSVDDIVPPEKLYGTTVNDRVSLNWEDKNTYSVLWVIYEKVNGEWGNPIAVARRPAYNINKVSNGQHIYGVTSIVYDASNNNVYESSKITYITLRVTNGEDKPGAGADIREISYTGSKDQTMMLTVYDNTYLHIKTDTLTLIGTSTNGVVLPDQNEASYFTSFGNDLYLKATKFKPWLMVARVNYTTVTVEGKTAYSSNGIKSTLTIHMNYVKGNAPVESKGIIYQLDGKKGIATVTGASNKNATKVAIPDKVKIGGKTYKVTKIAANAFKGMKKLKTVTIGKNVKEIGKNAFNGCKKLKTVTIKTTQLTKSSVKSGAFKGIDAKATVKCPKSKLKDYKKFLPGKGVPKTATIK